MAQQLQMQGEKVALLALFDTLGPGGIKKLPWQERVFIHLRNLLQQGSSYAVNKVSRRISSSVAQSDIRQQVRDLAVRNYAPQPYPGKMILFRAIKRNQFEAHGTDPQFGWGKLAAGGLEVHNVPGDHIGILKEPNVQVMATKLRASFEQAQVDDLALMRETLHLIELVPSLATV